MTDDMKTVIEPITPVTLTVIGGTGDGGAPLTGGLTIKTPDHMPNILIKAITPLMAVAIRFVNVYGTTFIGMLTAGMTPLGSTVFPKTFFGIVLTSAALALPGALVSLAKDILTIFGKLENKHPLLTGSV